jgi:hypothetical protein
MGRKRTCDPELVLDAFARKLTLKEISHALGVPIGTLGVIIHRARKAGDPRAPLRRTATPPPAPAVETPAQPPSARHRRRTLARTFPASAADLDDAVARTDVKPRRLQAGIATAGWRPSWLRI